NPVGLHEVILPCLAGDDTRCRRWRDPPARYPDRVVLVRDFMSRDVLKISESASVTELTSILTRHRITGLPVLDSKGKLVGVVSEFDVIERRGKTVGDIMSRELITIGGDAP